MVLAASYQTRENIPAVTGDDPAHRAQLTRKCMCYPSANGDVLTGQRLAVTKHYVAVSASSEHSILELRLFGLPSKSGLNEFRNLTRIEAPRITLMRSASMSDVAFSPRQESRNCAIGDGIPTTPLHCSSSTSSTRLQRSVIPSSTPSVEAPMSCRTWCSYIVSHPN